MHAFYHISEQFVLPIAFRRRIIHDALTFLLLPSIGGGALQTSNYSSLRVQGLRQQGKPVYLT